MEILLEYLTLKQTTCYDQTEDQSTKLYTIATY